MLFECDFCNFYVQETLKFKGLELDNKKFQIPADIAHVLGVVFNERAIRSEKPSTCSELGRANLVSFAAAPLSGSLAAVVPALLKQSLHWTYH